MGFFWEEMVEGDEGSLPCPANALSQYNSRDSLVVTDPTTSVIVDGHGDGDVEIWAAVRLEGLLVSRSKCRRPLSFMHHESMNSLLPSMLAMAFSASASLASQTKPKLLPEHAVEPREELLGAVVGVDWDHVSILCAS